MASANMEENALLNIKDEYVEQIIDQMVEYKKLRMMACCFRR